jgi:hypothetical protein
MTLTAAIIMFAALIGATALGGTEAGAQEESTQQALESRETTGPEVTSHSTTQIPTFEQSALQSGQPASTDQQDQNAEEAGNVQASTECPGAEVVDVIGPTSDDLRIGPFPITGEKFRLTYETSDLDRSGLPFLDVTVLDAEGNEVGGQVIFDAGTKQEIVGEGPGNFTIEARGDDLKYKITIEDCTGKENPNKPPSGGSSGASSPGGAQQPGTAPGPADQYGGDVGNPNDVIGGTISNKPLPNTGGVPLVGLAVFGVICLSAGLALLLPVIRRNP